MPNLGENKGVWLFSSSADRNPPYEFMNREWADETHTTQMGSPGSNDEQGSVVSSDESEGLSGTLAGVRSCIQTCVLQPRERSRAAARGEGAAGTPVPVTRALDDLLLLEALRRGDAEARVMLLERVEPFIERLIAGTLGFRDDLADIVTQVFVLALESIDELKRSTVLETWVGGLAVIVARGHIRRSQRRRWLRLLIPRDSVTARGPAFSPECCELVAGTYRLLDTLPRDDRLVFSLRFMADISIPQLAAILSIDEAAVDKRLARASARFKARVDRDPVLGRYGRAADPSAPVRISTQRPALKT